MRPPFTSRRRAEEFDALVEGESRSPALDDRYAELAGIVAGLREVPQPAPRPEFVADLRDRLMAEADTVLVPGDAATDALPTDGSPAPLRDPRRVRRDRRLAVALGTAALVGATGSVAVASQGSLPGEVLYPVKRALESAQAGLTQGDQGKGELMLVKAGVRLSEVEDLAGRDDAASLAATGPTLETFSAQADEAADLLLADHERTGREGSIILLRDFATSSMDRLTELATRLPEDVADELEHAGRTLLDIDARTREACPACGGETIGAVPRFLATAPTGQAGPGTEGSEGAVTSVGRQQPRKGGATPSEPPTIGPVLPQVGSVPPTEQGVPTIPGAPAPVPPGQTPGPGDPTRGGVVDGLKKTLVGNGGSTGTGKSGGGVVGGLGETLGTVTGTLLGEPVEKTVTGTTGAVGELLGGVLELLPDGSVRQAEPTP